MQVSLTDYTVFEANGCWNHIEKKSMQKLSQLNMM